MSGSVTVKLVCDDEQCPAAIDAKVEASPFTNFTTPSLIAEVRRQAALTCNWQYNGVADYCPAHHKKALLPSKPRAGRKPGRPSRAQRKEGAKDEQH